MSEPNYEQPGTVCFDGAKRFIVSRIVLLNKDIVEAGPGETAFYLPGPTPMVIMERDSDSKLMRLYPLTSLLSVHTLHENPVKPIPACPRPLPVNGIKQ